MREFADARVRPVKWVVEDLFPSGTPTLINAAAGAGKSILGLHLTLCIRAGIPWLGHDVTQGAVAYWDQDNPDDVLSENRIVAISRGMDIPMVKSPSARLFRLPYRVVGNPQKRDALIDSLKTFGATVLFVDTLAAVNFSSENSAEEMHQMIVETFFPFCEAGITPIIFHHMGKSIVLPTGKTAQRKGIDAGRGSSAVPAAVGTVFNLELNSRHNLVLSNAKPRYGKPPDIEIEYDEDGYIGDDSWRIKISRAEPRYSLAQLSQLLFSPEGESLRKLTSRELVKNLALRHIIVSQRTAARALKKWTS